MNYKKNTCRLHLSCDGDHPPYVRITGNIYGREGGLILTSGPVYAQEWLTFAAAPQPPLLWDSCGVRPSVSFPRRPRLQGVCVTISH